MTKKSTDRALSLILMQECGPVTDHTTLDMAIILAHHHKPPEVVLSMRVAGYPKDMWTTLFSMFREKFPQCPCKACKKKEELDHGRETANCSPG